MRWIFHCGAPTPCWFQRATGSFWPDSPRAFADLETAGLIDHRPRLIAVQPEGSSAIATALRAGHEAATAVTGAASVADSLTVEMPRNAIGCLAEIRASGGAGVIVSDSAIREAIPRLANLTGVFAEPAGAAALAGLHTALDEGLVDRDERVVLMVTGTGLKDVAAAAAAVAMPEPSNRPSKPSKNGFRFLVLGVEF